MPRVSRKSSDGVFFHIVSQGIKKSFIFNNEEDIKKYISIMFRTKEEYQVRIIAYCIMNNHVHLLLKVASVLELSSFMHKLNARYAQYYNKKYNRVGFVFRNRFSSENIYNEKYLQNCINYIFNNPVKAGICKRPEEYKFSNYTIYKKDEEIKENFLEYDFIDAYENLDDKCKYLIELYLTNKQIKLDEVVKSNEYLADLISILYNHNISFRCMARNIGINREKIRICYNKKLKMPK